MKKEERVPQKPSDTTKAHSFTNIGEVINVTNGEIKDTLYIAENIHIPEKKDIGRCYRPDFVLKTKEEAKILVKEKKAIFYHKEKDSDFFVYNERVGELLPFKKNDYLMYEHGYFTFDGIDYISYDDDGNEM